jgi:predicted glycosyltransferase involved in capsule biosynthesis
MNTPIIIPFRNRAAHLKEFMVHAKHPVIVVEQVDGKPFNRGKLLNIGAQIAFGEGARHIITHDVDMIPESVDYSEGECVHLAGAAQQFKYSMPYPRYFGGVNIYSSKAFYMANGYSNNYWGWGAEDDDMLLRCEKAGLTIERRRGRFTSLAHEHALTDPNARHTHKANCEYLDSGYDYAKDGLNTLEYSIVSETMLPNIHAVRVFTVDV